MHITALYKKELIKFGFSDNSHGSIFSYSVMKIKNHHKKNPDIFASYIFGPKCCLHVSKTTFPQKLFAYDCVTCRQTSKLHDCEIQT